MCAVLISTCRAGCMTAPPPPPACLPAAAVLFSNRSAALLHLNKVAKALADAEECVKLDPAFHKGWMRKGLVLEAQGQLQEVIAAATVMS